MKQISLNGAWELHRADDATSIPAQVPGCVHLDLLRAGNIPDPFYRDNELRLLWIGETDWVYSRSFTAPPDFMAHEHVLLVCHGLDTLATITVNGIEVGKTDNMFRRWELDVKPYLRIGKNTLTIRFDAPMPFLRAQEAEKGVLPAWSGDIRLNGGGWLRKEPCNFGWDWGPKAVTSGIWRDIALIAFDTRLTDIHIQQDHRPEGIVNLSIQVTVEGSDAAALRIEVTQDGKAIAAQQQPLSGDRQDMQIVIDHPRLWWVNGMGEQPLYDVLIQLIGANGNLLDQDMRRIGLRTLTLERHADAWGESFYFAVNGVPFFAKGANWIPADVFAPRLTAADYERLIRNAADVHMNMLRVWGGGIYEQDVFYDLCDRYGIAIWQDFMFSCATYPAFDAAFMDNVRAEAEDNIRRLRHHPCLALWCGNNELEQGLVGSKWTEHTMSWEDYSKLFDVLLPDAVHTFDPERAYWPCSPHTPVGERTYWMSPDSGDAHLWAVWHGKEPFEWYRTCLHRFASEFGFQSFPEPATVSTFTEPGDRNITSYVMEHHQRSGIGNSTIIHYMLDWFRLPTSFESTLWLSQILQGMAIKYAVEHWRRNMPRTMGTLYWQLNDCWPAPSWSSIDSLGRWKALHYLARHFYAPLLISGIEDPEAGTVDIHITSDLGEMRQGVVTWVVTTAAGDVIEQGRQAVSIAPRQNSRVKTLRLTDHLTVYGPRNLLVWLTLAIDETTISSNLVLFARPKHLNLADPDIDVAVQPAGNGSYRVELTARRPALWVWVTLPGGAALSDNFFHLRPGEPKILTVTPDTDTPADRLAEELRVRSLIDTYTT